MTVPSVRNLLAQLKTGTTARIGLGRAGSALPTAAALDFQLSHARARDAIRTEFGPGQFNSAFPDRPVIEVRSRAGARETYLMRPDLGRQLDDHGKTALRGLNAELVVVLADGLSAAATITHGPALARAIFDTARGWRAGPLVVAHQARVALGDEIGAALGAKLVIVLIGERPGLSSVDSLGAYITWQPRVGRQDSERNCVSNIRPPHGLSIEQAAQEIMRIAQDAKLCGQTGVEMPAALAQLRNGGALEGSA